MLYNIKVVSLHCVFHGIRFKVNEDWVSVIDTLLFFCIKSKLFYICGVMSKYSEHIELKKEVKEKDISVNIKLSFRRPQGGRISVTSTLCPRDSSLRSE
jgi:hypothetical protein